VIRGAVAQDGGIRIQVGQRAMRWARPRRVVFGRKHRHRTAFGEDFWGLGASTSMSRHWFGVEDVAITSQIDGVEESHLRVRCLSSTNSVLVWEGREPVRVQPQASYLAQGAVLFVGDLVEGLVVGARVSLAPGQPELSSSGGLVRSPAGAVSEDATAAGRTVSPGITQPPAGLDLSAATRDVVLARYHRYYRLPPDFDPQPTSWEQVAVVLGLLAPAQAADKGLLRRAVKDPQEAVTRLKQRVEALHPGWLPEASETQKTFHDHLRTILEMHRIFEPHEVDAFDARHPLARRPF